MVKDDELHVPFHEADCIVVEMFHDGSATFTLSNIDGELGAWEFPKFPIDDFMGSGLNVVGPWLNERGLAYTAWQTTGPSQETAVVYVYGGPEVDPRLKAGRGGS